MSNKFSVTGNMDQLPPITVTGGVHASGESQTHIGHRFEIRPDRSRQHLRGVDPRLDKQRIIQAAGGLLWKSYNWIFEHKHYKWLHENEGSQLLWITGEPGKGKTMLLCGIIDELQRSEPDSASNIAFFFLQTSDANLNSATAVLRGLVYLLIEEQKELLPHLQKEYDAAGKNLIEDSYAWEALVAMFQNMMNDPQLKKTIIVIDALDECRPDDLLKLLGLLSMNQASPRYKYIVSSRYNLKIEQNIKLNESRVRLNLEDNMESVTQAVQVYIEHSVSTLPIMDDPELPGQIQSLIKKRPTALSFGYLW